MANILNMNEVMGTLSDVLKGLVDKTIDPKLASAIANTTGKIFAGAKLQLAYMQMTGKKQKMELLALPEIDEHETK